MWRIIKRSYRKNALGQGFRPIFYFLCGGLLVIHSGVRCQIRFTRVASFGMMGYSGEIVTDGGISTGACWGDYDNDGFVDLFIANWNNDDNFLYRNNGDRTFTKIIEGTIAHDGGLSSGPCWGDYDNDGYLDLFVSNQQNQSNFLYHNNGNGTFTKVTEGDIVNDYGHNHTSTWGDYDNDGYLDLFVADVGQDNLLYKNNGDGTFEKITQGHIVHDGLASNGGSWADFDNDGDLDLFVPNKNGADNVLYQNNGDGSFILLTDNPAASDGGNSNGGSWGDYDNDGDLDLFVSNGPFFFTGENNALYRNDGDGVFTKITDSPVARDSAKSMSGCWGDFDHDGDLDLFVTNYVHDDMLYTNNGDGTFTQETDGMIVNMATFATGVGAGDYDNDGDLDLFLACWENQNNILYRNDTQGNHWIRIRCVGIRSNRFGVGAKVRIRATIHGKPVMQMREIRTHFGYRSQSATEVHFGLGDAASIEMMRVEWPLGQIDEMREISSNQIIEVTEGKGITNYSQASLPAKQSHIGILFQVYRNEGVDSMTQRYHALRDTASEKYEFSEIALFNLGNYILTAAKKPEDAVKIAQLSLQSYPESGTGYALLGFSSNELGDLSAARENFIIALDRLAAEVDLNVMMKDYIMNSIRRDLKKINH